MVKIINIFWKEIVKWHITHKILREKWIKQLTICNTKINESVKQENYFDLKRRIKDLESYIMELESDKETLRKTVVILTKNN